MEWIFVLLVYVAGIFLSRLLNKYMYKKGYSIEPAAWFIPFIWILQIAILLSEIKLKSQTNWFNGKNWKQ